MKKDARLNCFFSMKWFPMHSFLSLQWILTFFCDWEVFEHLCHHPCWMSTAWRTFSCNFSDIVVLVTTDSFFYFSHFASFFLLLNLTENLSFFLLTYSFSPSITSPSFEMQQILVKKAWSVCSICFWNEKQQES